MSAGKHPHGPGQHHGKNHNSKHGHDHNHNQGTGNQGQGGGGNGGLKGKTEAELRAELQKVRDAIAKARKAGQKNRLQALKQERERLKKAIKNLGKDPGEDVDDPKDDVPDPKDPFGDDPDDSDLPGDGVNEPGDDPDSTDPFGEEEEKKRQADLLADFKTFLEEWGLPATLLPQIQNWITNEISPTEITQRIYKSPEYLSVYPEGELRRQSGLTWWGPGQIREYRDRARAIARAQGIGELSNAEIARLITKDVSEVEWENRLQTWQNFKRWGPTVRSVLESELGLRIEDDRVFAFMSTDIPTPDLDRAYERALMRGQPALLGLGVRPEEEAELLRRYGISPEQAFRGYQGIVEEAPAQERFAFIEAEIERNSEKFPNGSQLFNDTPFALLFRAIQLQEGDAIRELQARLARETARFQAGGGATQQGTALTGLAPQGV